MSEIVLDFQYVDTLIETMQEIGQQGYRLEQYAVTNVCSSSGFGGEICVLNPLSDAMTALAGVFDQAFLEFHTRWAELQQALASATVDLRNRDESSAADYRTLMNIIDYSNRPDRTDWGVY